MRKNRFILGEIMKIKIKFTVPFMLAASIAFTACGGGGGGTASVTSDPEEAVGNVVTISVGFETVDMVYVNDQESINFPTGTNDDVEKNIARKYYMTRTEVTNALFAAVYQWAYDNGKFSDTVADHNGINDEAAKNGGNQLVNFGGAQAKVMFDPGTKDFSVTTGFEDYPVVHVTWYGAIMFCNWLTEMMTGTDELVYGGITSSWASIDTVEDADKKGYRLPSSNEWEFAARYRGGDSINTVDGYSNPSFTKGNSASGATTFYFDYAYGGGEPGKSANDSVAVYYSYWDGVTWVATGVTGLAVVASKGPFGANELGLYDMSGNVWEWCFTADGVNRVQRNGSWSSNSVGLQVGSMLSAGPGSQNSDIGFRFSRTR